MKTKICPMCKGTGRIEIKTMDKKQMRIDLNKGVIHNVHHALLNLDNKITVETCLRAAWEYAGKVLKELDKEEEEEEPKPSKLVVHNGILCFENEGIKPFLGIGVSRREILIRASGYQGGLYGKPLKFFLDLTTEYKLNFERVDSTKNLNILGFYLADRSDKDIVVELTIADGDRTDMGKPEDTIDFVANQGYLNVIIEPWNEFNLYKYISIKDQINQVKHWIQYANDRGLLTSAGAYAAKSVSEKFNPVKSGNRIISIHRSYEDGDDVKNTVFPYRKSGKPMSWNEPHHISAQHFYNAAKDFYRQGVRLINYYGLRSHELFPDLTDDTNVWREYYIRAQQLRGQLCA